MNETPMKRVHSHLGPVLAIVLCVSLFTRLAGAATVELFVNAAQPAGAIDLTPYGLGQGGLSAEPMFNDHVDDIAALRPQTIRLFVQEYFNLYPAHEVYHWDTLDRSIENILATGARPLMCLCFKPRVLYPQINQDIISCTRRTTPNGRR